MTHFPWEVGSYYEPPVTFFYDENEERKLSFQEKLASGEWQIIPSTTINGCQYYGRTMVKLNKKDYYCDSCNITKRFDNEEEEVLNCDCDSTKPLIRFIKHDDPFMHLYCPTCFEIYTLETKLDGEQNWRYKFKDEKKELEERKKHLEEVEKEKKKRKPLSKIEKSLLKEMKKIENNSSDDIQKS